MDAYSQNLLLAAPEIFLGTAICLVLVIDVFLSRRAQEAGVTYYLALLTLVGTSIVTLVYGPTVRTLGFSGSYVADPAGNALKLFSFLVVALAFLYARDDLIRRGLNKGEFYVLALFALLGIMVMISAHSLLTLYLGLELLSLSLYGLVAFNRDSPVAAEAAIKYFVLGAIASGCLLYGMSILYGVLGTLELAGLAGAIGAEGNQNLALLLALAFVVVGVAFKFGAVPFHMWLPDVYQGAPTPVTLFIGTAPKIAAFALVWRLLAEGLAPLHDSWQDMITVLAVLSLVIGNLVAIAQTNLKRMLAYSTISHVGFILLGILAGTAAGLRGAMYYTLVYTLMAAGGFAMIIALSRRGFEAETLADFKGLNARSPWLAFLMLMFMFSMAGVPPFVGFYAKLVVIGAVLDVGMTWLAILAVLLSVVGAFYYLRVVWYMYFSPPDHDQLLESNGDFQVVLSTNGLAMLALGLFPGVLLDVCNRLIS